MASPLGNDDPDAPVVVGRRSARLSMIVPITIKGTDDAGQAFKENTWTIGVNKHGARLATFHTLAVGDQIVVENPVLGRTAKCRVIRVCEKRFPEDPYEIGVELLEAQNVWGVKFPPEDWQKNPTSPVTTRPAESSGPAFARREPPPRPAPQGPQPSEILKPPPERETPAPSAEHPEKFNQFNLAVTGLSRFAQDAQETAESSVKPQDGAPEGASQAGLQKAINSLEEKVSMVQSLEKQLTLLAGRLQSSRGEFENLLSKARVVQQGWHAEIESVEHNIQTAGREVLKSAADELSLGLHQELQSASAAFLANLRQKVEEETSKALETFRMETAASQNAQSRLAGDAPDRSAQQPLGASQPLSGEMLDSLAEPFKESMTKFGEETAASFREKIKMSVEEAVGEIVPRLNRDLEEKARAAAQNEDLVFRKALEAARGEVQAETSDAVHKVRMYYDAAADAAKTAATQEIESARGLIHSTAKEELSRFQSVLRASESESKDNIGKELAELLTSAQASLHQAAAAELQSLQDEFRERVKAFGQERMNEISDQLVKTTNELTEASDQALRQRAANVLEDLSGSLETTRDSIIEGTKQQLENAIHASSSVLRKEAEAIGNELKSVSENFRTFGQDVVSEAQKRLQGVSALLDDQLAGSAERAMGNFQAGSERLVKDASDALTREVGLAAMVTKDWAEQARALLDLRFQKSMQDFEKWIGDQTQASREQVAKESRAALDGLRARINKASSLFETPIPEKPAPAQETVTPPNPPEQAPELETVPEEFENPIAVQVRTKQQQAVNDAVEAFRKKIAESLATFPLSTKPRPAVQALKSKDDSEKS